MTAYRYVTRPPQPARISASYYDGSVDDMIHMPDSCMVVVEDRTPEYTGLCDAHGRDLYRVPQTVRIGFHV